MLAEQQAGTEHSLGSTPCPAKATVYKESKFKTLLTTLKRILLDIAMNELQETRQNKQDALRELNRGMCLLQEHQAVSSRTMIHCCVGRNLDIICLFHLVCVVLIELLVVL